MKLNSSKNIVGIVMGTVTQKFQYDKNDDYNKNINISFD